MRTAAQAKQEKVQHETELADMMAEAANKPKAQVADKKKSHPMITDVRRRVKKEKVRRELDKTTLQAFIEAIRVEYPEKRFNMDGSTFGVYAHYLSKDERTPDWPFVLTTDGNKFWLHDGVVYAGKDNNW